MLSTVSNGGFLYICKVLNNKITLNIELQVGIVAWGIDCGMPEIPGVYASVADGLCFIDW